MNEPLVLLPSFMADARIWGAQIEVFSQTHAVHLAHIGYEGSIEDMAEMALVGAPETFSLAGHGLGAMVAVEMLRRAPDRVKRIALMSTNCLSETPPAAAERDLRIARAKAGLLAEAMNAKCRPIVLRQVTITIWWLNSWGKWRWIKGWKPICDRPKPCNAAPINNAHCAKCGCRPWFYAASMTHYICQDGTSLWPDWCQGRNWWCCPGHAPMVERPRATNEALQRWMKDEPQAPLLERV